MYVNSMGAFFSRAYLRPRSVHKITTIHNHHRHHVSTKIPLEIQETKKKLTYAIVELGYTQGSSCRRNNP